MAIQYSYLSISDEQIITRSVNKIFQMAKQEMIMQAQISNHPSNGKLMKVKPNVISSMEKFVKMKEMVQHLFFESKFFLF